MSWMRHCSWRTLYACGAPRRAVTTQRRAHERTAHIQHRRQIPSDDAVAVQSRPPQFGIVAADKARHTETAVAGVLHRPPVNFPALLLVTQLGQVPQERVRKMLRAIQMQHAADIQRDLPMVTTQAGHLVRAGPPVPRTHAACRRHPEAPRIPAAPRRLPIHPRWLEHPPRAVPRILAWPMKPHHRTTLCHIATHRNRIARTDERPSVRQARRRPRRW